MDNNEITVKVTLKLDEKWASDLSKKELIEFIRSKLSTSLGFRGQVAKVSVSSQRYVDNGLKKRYSPYPPRVSEPAQRV